MLVAKVVDEYYAREKHATLVIVKIVPWRGSFFFRVNEAC
jgi:hypothetical protein